MVARAPPIVSSSHAGRRKGVRDKTMHTNLTWWPPLKWIWTAGLMASHSLSSGLSLAFGLRPNVTVLVDQPPQSDPNLYLRCPWQWLMGIFCPLTLGPVRLAFPAPAYVLVARTLQVSLGRLTRPSVSKGQYHCILSHLKWYLWSAYI